MTDDELRLLLSNKGITEGRAIVLYADAPEQVHELREKLTDLGYTDIASYDQGFDHWASDPDLPVESLARYDKLVHPEWLQQLISG